MNLIHVQTAPGQTAPQEVANGNVMTAFASITNGAPIVKAGKVRGLAVTSVKRNAQLKDVPTMIESGFADFEVVVWSGICGPAGVPKPIVSK